MTFKGIHNCRVSYKQSSCPCTTGSGSNHQPFFYPSSSQRAPWQRGDQCWSIVFDEVEFILKLNWSTDQACTTQKALRGRLLNWHKFATACKVKFLCGLEKIMEWQLTIPSQALAIFSVIRKLFLQTVCCAGKLFLQAVCCAGFSGYGCLWVILVLTWAMK